MERVKWDELAQEIKINDINEALYTHTDLFVKYAVTAAKAEADKQDAKYSLERICAIVKENLRAQETRAGNKVTEARLNDLVVNTEEYTEAVDKYINASFIDTEWKLAMQALSIRKDMLISYSANHRSELTNLLPTDSSAINGAMKQSLETLRSQLGTTTEEN